MSVKSGLSIILIFILTKSTQDIVFTHALIYKYETLTEKGELWLYHNPKTGNILFVPEDEMVDYVIADTLGNYHFFGDDGHGQKTIVTKHIDWVTDELNGNSPKSDHLITFKPIAENKVIKHAEGINQDIICKGFKMIYHKAVGQQNIFFTENIPINSCQIYGFNRLEGDIRLPVPQLDMIGIVSKKQLVTHIENDIFKLELVAYEYNPFELNIAEYKFIKQNKYKSKKD